MYFDDVRQERLHYFNDTQSVLEVASDYDPHFDDVMRQETFWHWVVVPILLVVIGYFMDPKWLFITIPIAAVAIPLTLWRGKHGKTTPWPIGEGPDSHHQTHQV